MGITNVIEKDNEGSSGHSYTRVFLIETSSPSIGPAQVLLALPQEGSFYTAHGGEVDILAQVPKGGVSVKRLAKKKSAWEGTVNYEPPEQDDDEDDKEPHLRFPKVSWTHEIVEEVAKGVPNTQGSQTDTNAFGAGLTNSAGEPFDPPIMIEVARPVLTITRFVKRFVPSQATKYVNAVNQDAFWGWGAWKAKIIEYSTPGLTIETFGNNQKWTGYEETVKVAFNKNTWKTQVLDHGSYYLDSGNQVKFTDKIKGFPIQGRLNGTDGSPLDPADDDKFLTFELLEELPFAALGLPQRMPQ